LIISVLLLMWSIIGILVVLFERRHNSKMFGDGFVRGLGNGIWWAAVTMTTVGYGDKSPITFGGRIIAVIWMFLSIMLISSVTAAITTSLTVNELSGKVRGYRDLATVRVGAFEQSQAHTFLVNNGITVIPFENHRIGLQALTDTEIDAFVHDDYILKHLVKTQFPGQVTILPEIFDNYFMSMAIPTGHPIREPLNLAILRFIETGQWEKLKLRYLGR
jgi:polar amino acid transport system substrate-binding protein